jgi:peptide subunit release factor 1 (eRF1)
MTLDDARIRELLRFDDEGGVLSFYVGHTPEQAADPQPTAPIEIRNQIKALKARLPDRDGLGDRVAARLEEVRSDLDRLLDPHEPGRGRALFVGVDSGRTETVAVQIPFAERVIHHDSAYVRPLVAAADEGRPAGIWNVSHEYTRLLTWALGEVEELSTSRFEIEDDVAARGKSGPVGGVAHTQGRSDRDSYTDRIDENRARFLRADAEVVAKEAVERGWDRVVVAGGAKVRDDGVRMLQDVLPDGVRVLAADQTFEDAAPHRIADGVWHLLRSVHLDREAELVDTAVDRGLGGNAGAVGLRRVCDALNEGRVRHLLYAADLQLEGYLSDEGTVHPRVEGAAAQSDTLRLHREPLFVERLIEKAVQTGAIVTSVDHEVAGPLQAHEGVGALLRW